MPVSLRRVIGGFFFLVGSVLFAQTKQITIIHTNDLHAKFLPNHENRGGFASVAAAIKKEKQNCRACLTLHAGDFITGSPVSTIYEGIPVFEIANAMGFDASTIGNHEFDHGWQQVPKFLHLSRFPLLLSNVRDLNGLALAPKAYQIFKAGDVRVGVIGGLTEDMPNLTTPMTFGPFRVDPLVATLRRQILAIRGQVDLVVLLLHITQDEEDLLLRELEEAPVLITGHTHRGLEAPKVRDGRVMVRVRAFGFEIGRLDLTVDIAKKNVSSFTWKKIAISPRDQKPDPKVARMVSSWESKVTRDVDVQIGESRRVYTRPELRSLFAQAMKDEMKADFAFINDGAMRDELPRGRITIRDIYNIMPFNNRVLAGTFKGNIIPTIVREGFTIEPEKPYRLIIQDFTLYHQKEQLGVVSDLEFPEQGPLFRNLLIQWIRHKKIIE